MTTQILSEGESQLVRLPAGFEFATPEVEIRREGEAVILEPVSPSEWPADFFADSRIDDPAFKRGDQGELRAEEAPVEPINFEPLPLIATRSVRMRFQPAGPLPPMALPDEIETSRD